MIYKIKKGNHYSLHLPKLHLGKTNLKVKFRFLDGCWFPLKVKDDYAVNKLCGWSYGWHHKNSIRCGWTPNKEQDKIDLFFYIYSNGERHIHSFCTIDIRTEYSLEIDLIINLLSFSIRSDSSPSTILSYYYEKPKSKLGYMLFPYIGGNLPAHTDTKISIE